MTEKRRKAILELLGDQTEPITGNDLAQHFQVSRQVIVQDIAVLRASGIPIVGALNGYRLVPKGEAPLRKTFVSHHTGESRMEEELQIIVDFGGRMINTAVSHPIYGDIVCPLSIKNREDIRLFILRLSDEKAAPLSSLTEGFHFHTIEVDSEETFAKIFKTLEKRGFIPQKEGAE